MSEPAKDWNGATVRTWLESRIASARAEQERAQRRGRDSEDDCDIAAAEEMVCAWMKGRPAVDVQADFLADLKTLLARDDYIWRGVYNDTRFDRHVRSYIRKLTRMAKTNSGFEKLSRFQ